jgi:hypothetical protein
VISWSIPGDGSSSIIGYIISIRQSDNVTYTQDLVNCNGNSTSIIISQSCSIPITVLTASPFNLVWGQSIYATVSAINSVGISLQSSAGSGAILVTLPGAPINVVNVVTITTGT